MGCHHAQGGVSVVNFDSHFGRELAVFVEKVDLADEKIYTKCY